VSKMDDELDVALGKTIATLRRELEDARKATELCGNGQRTLIEKVEQANVKLSAVTIDNAMKDVALGTANTRIIAAIGSIHLGEPAEAKEILELTSKELSAALAAARAVLEEKV
jgi:hypothetical protein